MAEFFRTSALWVVDYLYEGRPRRWYRAALVGVDPAEAVAAELAALHGPSARLQAVRPATADEEGAYQRGEVAPNRYCPVNR